MLLNKKFFIISMPRTGNTWAEILLSRLSGFSHFETRHKLSSKFSNLNIPQLSFFRDPHQWYLSMFRYYQSRKSGDIYSCLNHPLRFKNIFWRENISHWQGSKLLMLRELLISLSGNINPKMEFD